MIPDLIELEEQRETRVLLSRAEQVELADLRFDIAMCSGEGNTEAASPSGESQADRAQEYHAYWVNPKEWVGHFRLCSEGSRTVSIRPKVGIHNVFALLGACYERYADDSPFLKLTVRYDVDITHVIERLVKMFSERVRELLLGGLLRKYVEIEEDCGAVKGRIVFSQQVARNLIHAERIFCRFARSETDIPENQVILFTLLLLRRISQLSAPVRRELTAHILHFGDVSIRQFLPRQMPQFTYDRLSSRYQDVHSWCRLFIDMMSLSDKPGERIFSGFRLNMNVLFERFVISMFERAAQKVFGIAVRPKIWQALTINTQLGVMPDLLLRRDECVTIPVDAKYKRTVGPDKAKHPDLYQIIAYCNALGVTGRRGLSPHGILVYPRGELTPELTAQIDIITRRGAQGPESGLKVAVHDLDLTSKEVVNDTEERFQAILEHLRCSPTDAGEMDLAS